MRLLPLALLASLPFAAAAAPDVSDIVFQQRLGQTLPLDASFVDQVGLPVQLRDLVHDRPTVLALGYYACPALCGLVRDDLLTGLAQTGLVAGRDYTLLFVSIDPAERPTDAARAMADDLRDNPVPGAPAGWAFLTGSEAEIAAVEQAVGYSSRFDAALKQFIHPAGLVMITPGGTVSSYLLGAGYHPGDLRAGLLQASTGSIGQAALPILLLCFHFDSTTGRYTLEVVKLLRLGGVVTVLGIGALLLVLRHRRRAMAAS